MSESDNLTAIPMWLEAYQNELERTGDEAKATLYADTLIDRVNGSPRKYDTAGIMRGSEMQRAMSMFYSFLNTEYNRWEREFGMAALPEGSKTRLLGFIGARLLFFATASAMLSGKGPKDDEDWAKWWLNELASYPLSFFPGIREVLTVAKDEALGMRSFGYRPSPVVSAVESALFAAKTGVGVVKGDKTAAEGLEAASKVAAYALPYPDQFNVWFFNAYDAVVNDMEPKPIDFMKRRPKKERRD
jgi:hypothetical protein